MTALSLTESVLLKREKGKFFKMGADVRRGGKAGFAIENLSKLLRGGNVLEPKLGTRGFPEYPEPPLIRLDKTSGRPLRDLELYHCYWLISLAAKNVFTSVDPEGFAFVQCNVVNERWEPGPEYWLCDVTRVVDAIDDERSSVKIKHDSLGKRYDLSGRTKLVFVEDRVKASHVFRPSYYALDVFCDRQMKNACKSAGLKGISFRDAIELP
jgi:Immunity protein family (Imm11)